MMFMDFNQIIDLEKKLLESSSRKDGHFLNAILSDDFVEFGSSGKEYNKKMIIERLPQEVFSPIEAFDFVSVQLAADLVQIRFKTRQKNEEGSTTTCLRSSLWSLQAKSWRMIFHQGTKIIL